MATSRWASMGSSLQAFVFELPLTEREIQHEGLSVAKLKPKQNKQIKCSFGGTEQNPEFLHHIFYNVQDTIWYLMGTKKKTAGKCDLFSQEKAIDGDQPQGSPQIWGISN